MRRSAAARWSGSPSRCARWAPTSSASADGTAPLRVRGRRTLSGLTWRSPVASAQVKSAILLAALSAGSPTTVVEPVPTRDHTERMLRMCGIDVVSDGTLVDGAAW